MTHYYQFFSRATSAWPILTKSLTSGALFFGGDLICQALERVEEIDWKRTGRMTIFGTIALGPFAHFWYRFLDKRFPDTSGRTILKKVAMDQLLFSPPFYAAFYLSMSTMEGKSPSESWSHLRQQFLPTYGADLCVWPIVQAVNFRYVPPRHRVLAVGVVSVFWNAFLSSMHHSHSHSHALPAVPALLDVADSGTSEHIETLAADQTACQTVSTTPGSLVEKSLSSKLVHQSLSSKLVQKSPSLVA
eukprot:TRINITY_DN15_c8_g1_i1.p1 TRINITY_DN15_c8_g1~~TRINITY_DN15_c8_g1_i1.p1  ORF type:complete len:246 (-),score=9.56 TRINITY_DN15_c8_g1_i1:396-1133(-)